MSALNIKSAQAYYGETNVRAPLTTSLTTVLANPAESGRLYRVNEIKVANIDGANSADVTIDISKQGVPFAIASTVPVPADSTFPAISKEISFYLEEGDAIVALASANDDLEISITYEIYSPSWDRVTTRGLQLYLDAADYNSFNRSTNLFTYSEDFANAAWAKNFGVTTNAIAGPVVNGVRLSADKIFENATTTNQWLMNQNPYTAVANDVNTVSIYAKAAERSQIGITSFGEGYSAFNLSNGTIIQTGGHVCSIENVGDGWYRCRATITEVNVTTSNWYFLIWNNTNSYAGVVNSGIYVAGAQFERAKSYLSNYTKTVATTVTDSATWKDLTESNRNGTLTNGPVFDSSNNGSIAFAGTDDRVVTSSTTIAYSGGTFEIWVKLNSVSINQGFLTHNQGYPFINLYMDTNGKMRWEILSAVGVGGSFLSNTTFVTNRWYHVVGTFTTGFVSTLYVNGVQDAQQTYSGSPPSSSTAIIYVGDYGAGNFPSNSNIAVARIYDRALSADEILKNYDAEKLRFATILHFDASVPSSYSGSQTWFDLSGSRNNGTLTNGPTSSTDGNGSLQFTAASAQYVTVADSASLTASNMSIEVWVKFSTLGTRIIYCGKGQGGGFADTEYWLEKTAGDKFSIWFSNGTTGQNHLLASSSVSANVWYHVVSTFDGSTMRGYVNGVQDPATFSLSGSIVNTSFAYAVGRLGTLASLYHNGNVAINRIYNRALTASEVLTLYRTDKARFGL